jgi:hypothetical protein
MKEVVAVLNNAMDGQDESVSYELSNGIDVSTTLQNGKLTLRFYATAAVGAAFIHQFEESISTLQYQNTAEEPTPGTREFEFYSIDSLGGVGPISGKTTAKTKLLVENTNDKPVIDLSGPDEVGLNYFLKFTENGEKLPVVNTQNLTITDNDNGTIRALEATLLDAPDGVREYIDVTIPENSSLTRTTINNGLGFRIEGNAKLSVYTDLARSITYSNELFDYDEGRPTVTPRKISFWIDDGLNQSEVVFTSMGFASVNDEPFVDLAGQGPLVEIDVTFTEEQGEVRLFPDGLILYDIDNDTLAYVDVTITNALDGDLESLNYAGYKKETDLGGGEVAVTLIDPEVTYNPALQTLRIEGLKTVADYQKILRTVTYNNLADEPLNEDRVITVTAHDGLLSSVVRQVVVSTIQPLW